MRTIKFRAWDKRTKGWLLWDDGLFKAGELTYTFEYVYQNPEFFELMQFTGLYDKNEKEVFEGDIYDVYSVGKAVIEFRMGQFVARYGKKPLQFVHISNQDEVIGNIYENPELTPTE